MKMPDCYVSGVLATFLRVSRFAGIAPLRFVKKGDGWQMTYSRNISFFGNFVMVILNLVIFWALISHIWLHQSNLALKMSVRSVVWTEEVILVVTMANVMVFSAPSHLRCLVICLNQVQEIKDLLNSNYWPKYSRTKQIGFLILWLITNSVIFSTATVLLLNIPQREIRIKVTHSLWYILSFIIQLGIIKFMLLTLHVGSSFKSINNSLNSLLQENVPESVSRPERVRTISMAYGHACHTARDVNRGHGFMLMLLIIYMLQNLVITPYYFIINFIFGSYFPLSQFLLVVDQVSQFFTCVFHFTNLVMCIEPWQLTLTEMELTRDLVSRLMVRPYTVNDPLEIELDKFCKQLALNDVKSESVNVVMMTRSSVLTIIGCITTYLVVLINLKD